MLKKIKSFILISVFSGLLYLGLTLPLRDILSVFTVTEVRPCAVLNPFLGICFGLPSAIGIAIGNFLADYISGYSWTVLLEGLPLQFLYTYIPYLLWRKLCKGEDHIHRLDTTNRVSKYVLVVLVYALISSAGVGFIVASNYHGDFFNSAIFVFLNNFTFGIILGCPLMVISNLHMAKRFGTERSISKNEKVIVWTAIFEIIMIAVITYVIYNKANINGTLDIWDTIFIYSMIGLYICMALSFGIMKYNEIRK